jgi:hypothetical protein
VGHGIAKRHVQIHQVIADTSDESNSSADEADIEDSGTYHLINEIKQVKRDYARKNKIGDSQRVYRKASWIYNNRYPSKNHKGQRPCGARQVGQGVNVQGHPNPNQGQPNTMEGQQGKKIFELLALANIAYNAVDQVTT